MKVNLLGFDLAVFDINLQIKRTREISLKSLRAEILSSQSFQKFNLVAAQDNRNRFAHTHNIPMPIGDILVGHPSGNIEHNDSTLAIDVIS